MWYERGVALPESVTTFEHDGTTYHVLGTAHVSQRSVDEVREVIAEIKPDVVCVELDKGRYDALTKDSAFRDLDVFKVVREGKTLYLLAHLALASYQRRIGASLGVKPGAELIAAVDAAKQAGIPYELIDRDIQITLKRTWKNIGLWRRFTLLLSLVAGGEDKGEPVTAETVESLKEPKALSEMLTELGNAVPEVKEPLVDERDRYLTSKMLEAGAGKKTVVAVVGAAHVPGMQAQVGTPVDRAALEAIAPPALWWRIGKWVVPLAFIGLLAYLATRMPAATFAKTMLAWIIPTSIGAGAAVLLSGGSILTVLAATVAAPIARVYPLVRTAVVVGIVEAWRRKPSVQDCERLQDDVQTVKGFWRNPVTRILIIAVLGAMGALVGFAVGVGVFASRL
jgi:pheromone shutdown-related protein TraB